MAEEMHGRMNTENVDLSVLQNNFNNGQGFDGEGLDDSGKNLDSKTAMYDSVANRVFDDYMNDFANNVSPNFSQTALVEQLEH